MAHPSPPNLSAAALDLYHALKALAGSLPDDTPLKRDAEVAIALAETPVKAADAEAMIREHDAAVE